MTTRSTTRAVSRSVTRGTSSGAGSGGDGLPNLPYNSQFVIDDLGNYLIDDLGNYLVAYITHSVGVLVEDGASAPRLLVAADILTIGYYQIFGGVRATPGAVMFTPVDLASAGASWVSGGIFDSPAGTLRIDLPIHAFVGDPDEIEIEIVPVSGTVVLPDPIVEV